jgi:hypothetical protein
VPQVVAAKVEVRKFTYRVFQCVLHDRRQGQFPKTIAFTLFLSALAPSVTSFREPS